MKQKTDDEMICKFDKLPNHKKVLILFDALDIMQQYNGRTKQDCIILAMGGIPEGYLR